jgi:hypothetical protein
MKRKNEEARRKIRENESIPSNNQQDGKLKKSKMKIKMHKKRGQKRDEAKMNMKA